jgi:o-succinylbenzoate synthase
MRVRSVVLQEIRMRLLAPFETSVDRIEERRIILVEVDVDGVTGWGECVAGEQPYYSPETTDTAWLMMTEFLWPMLRGKEFGSSTDVWGLFAQVRGHNMAKAAIESAIWDAEAKAKGVPLWKLLGGVREEVASGVSIGIKGTVNELAKAVRKELADGYQRVKIKIKPGKDFEPVKRVRDEFRDIKLMVDANSAYSMEDWPLLKQLDGFYLMMIEQPLGWDDLYSHAELQKRFETPICLDECIHTEEQARAAIALGACKIINMKMGRVGGHAVMRRIHDLCAAKGVPMWCGGMLESGIGRAHNIALSTLPNFTLPGDVAASKRYWDEDVIEPEVTVSSRGTIKVPTGPGIGFAPRVERIEKLTVRKERLT